MGMWQDVPYDSKQMGQSRPLVLPLPLLGLGLDSPAAAAAAAIIILPSAAAAMMDKLASRVSPLQSGAVGNKCVNDESATPRIRLVVSRASIVL